MSAWPAPEHWIEPWMYHNGIPRFRIPRRDGELVIDPRQQSSAMSMAQQLVELEWMDSVEDLRREPEALRGMVANYEAIVDQFAARLAFLRDKLDEAEEAGGTAAGWRFPITNNRGEISEEPMAGRRGGGGRRRPARRATRRWGSG